MGYNRYPLFIMLTEQRFCEVSFIKINQTELPKLIWSKLDRSETLSLQQSFSALKKNYDQNLVISRSLSGDPLNSNLSLINMEFHPRSLSEISFN